MTDLLCRHCGHQATDIVSNTPVCGSTVCRAILPTSQPAPDPLLAIIEAGQYFVTLLNGDDHVETGTAQKILDRLEAEAWERHLIQRPCAECNRLTKREELGQPCCSEACLAALLDGLTPLGSVLAKSIQREEEAA